MQLKTSTIEADGKTYILSMSANAMCEMEEKAAAGFGSILADLAVPERITISRIRWLFWAALTDNHPEITVQEAGRLIEACGGLSAAVETIINLFEDGGMTALVGPDASMSSSGEPQKA
ncbi:MAG: hypothetical protein HY852_03535 [Bradyrhizobium sp.]|uniref:hypothetical protein n=1 Tax=Bradyrhizobium sp. TaxID=376 RepID=UPI0025C26BF4|nr:hypothetical protein [Bradyrhizobium sp.]MBI5260875.1 hypothetical protein [Bradyrhizobium sp.]